LLASTSKPLTVVERDRDCVFAGCEAPNRFCDVHHLVEWIDDGETSLDNSALLCERHHTKIHHGFGVERDDSAPLGHRWRTWRPDGTEIGIHPPLRAA
jgi:HNH endonuclease